ncbi:hypothetical protein CoHVHLJ_122 [Columbid alphaherpesvirus 1]|uniref:Uncharacterized protein n=1 Tax=Columbid alphaherpesvirus 1 TaxID=93386 RepID=A0A1V0M8Q0_9ALPH|nr:hypothetical protein CoHVHLJ_094 [Columbid alphaherpesvirus 1]YP_009353016.1 hypothetical protein CoHVHLJ_122 [Columbid alphaherpesvirus 1]ARD71405.1 hypothetical protein CoHVHLJ_094 [Columbid alphaherpesvirus 1]ARD71433.1 hypothetical protein CoHVHLJ_122 [Columbid alphaherpesvirus 1]
MRLAGEGAYWPVAGSVHTINPGGDGYDYSFRRRYDGGGGGGGGGGERGGGGGCGRRRCYCYCCGAGGWSGFGQPTDGRDSQYGIEAPSGDGRERVGSSPREAEKARPIVASLLARDAIGVVAV